MLHQAKVMSHLINMLFLNISIMSSFLNMASSINKRPLCMMKNEGYVSLKAMQTDILHVPPLSLSFSSRLFPLCILFVHAPCNCITILPSQCIYVARRANIIPFIFRQQAPMDFLFICKVICWTGFQESYINSTYDNLCNIKEKQQQQ